ncbi:non-ribosomal peptide synthetase, partial [Paraburkholderia caballeronis]|uniref:non-ribosomal peptide synthetase n=1 Tax=Paraburkholderia caballeronis TaxID=416943 RepID=UPI00141704A0
MLISLEGHGREIPDDALATELDLSRTVGWFTTRYPVWLKRSDDTGAILRETKSRIRSVPHRGLHFGLLREKLKDLPQPQVSFNYLGQFDQSIGGENRFAFAGEPHGESMAQSGESPYVLDLNALVAGGELTLAWDYDATRLDAEQVEHLVVRFDENLSALVAHCMNAGPLITAADFPLSGLTDAQLDALALPLPAVDDIYPATPLQQGLLFHTLLDKRPGLYVNQKRLTFEGRLDARAMRDAWQAALDRHAVLRTRFEWRHDGPALQVVDARLALPFDPHDWSALTADVYETRLANWLRDDARRGFDLSRAPLVRVALFARPDGGHDLVWTNHHILTDGWSAAQLLGEISRDYALRCAGSRLDVAPVPYRNYVAWRARQDDSLDWWSARRAEVDDPAQLADAIGASEPNEAHEPREPHEQPLLSDRELPAASVHALTSAARRAHVTLNTLLQGAWAILLARYSGRRQVAFGVTVSGRPPELPGIETMIGLFINSLPVWVDVRNDAPLDAWLGRLQQYNAELRLREHTPLDALKRHLGGAGAEPFDSLLIFENYPVETGLRRFGDRLTLGAWQSFERTHYPLSLTITAEGESIRLAWIADPAHVDAATLERIANAYVRIASALAGGDAAWVGDVGVPSEPSRPVPLESHHGLPLPARFAAEARRRPAARAVSCDGRHLSYDGLDRLSNRIANALLRAGVPREARVALCTARSADMVAGLLGILKAGAAYVPLDPAYPAARLGDMLDDSRVEWIVTDARNAASGHPCFEGRRIVVIEAVRDAADGADEADEAPDVAIEPAQLAYVIYTSGSTGRPKGVGISHDALGRFLASVGARIGLRPGDRMLAATTLSFDIAGLELYLPLVCGAQVEIAPRDVVQDGHRFARWVERADGTVLQATPSGWRNLLEGGWAGQRGMTALCGGEALPRDLADALLARGVTLWNLYGPTETTIWSTVGLVRAGEPVTLGEPLHDTVLRVLGADGAEAPPGGMGELCIGGAMLARGYVGRPALTAERFVPDPHGDGARLYRTGDLVRRHADGSLAYLGRADQQVKLHGYRIEPGEVEAVLRRMPGVRDAVVVVRGHAIDARLTGYVAVGPDAGDAAVTADTLRAFASARLPAHMVPGAWGLLDALPLTPNGKVDRRRLPDPDAAAATWEAPRGEAETTLAALWSQVLGVERVGRRDDFFALGGHSLLAVRMTSRVRQALARDVTLQTVFRHPSLAAFADAVRALAPIDGEAAASTTTREAPRDDRGYPLSHAQERLWFLWKLAPQSAAYHMAGALRLTGPLDRAALKHALDTLVERHASLRTRFASDDGVATQAIVAAAAYGWSEHDLGGIDLGIGEAARDARLQTLLEAAASEPFDLERGPVFRASLVELTPDAHVLQFAMHHIVSDGWSQTILLREFGELYAAAVEARPPQLPALPRQYAEYARDERERADDARIASDLDWWREQLGAAHPVLVLPSTRKAADERHERSDRGGRQLAELTPAQWDRVKALANRHHATPFMVLLAAYALLLQRLGGQDDVRIGFPVAGRDRADVERVVGFFVNTLVARVRVSPRQPFAALLASVRDTVIDAQSHGNVPFATLIDALQPTRSLGQTPLFQAMFNFEPGPGASALRLPGLTVEPVETDRAFAQFDLSLHVREHADGARLSMVYASDRFDAATVERWLGYYVRVLETAVDDAPRATGNVALLSGDEHASHVALGRCDADYGTPEPVHRLIAKQARTRPYAQAVVYRDSVLTYAELDAAANRVAHRLAALGVGPDVCVGLAAERSTEMVVGLLGILKAGGAYVPLDPDYPRERLSYMLDDSGVRLLLTQSRLRSRLPVPAGVDVLELDAADLSGEPPTDPGVTVHGDNLAYVIYTSGSTGKPKGAANRHDALYNRLAWMQSAYRLDDTDTVLQKTPFSFDVSVWEFFWPLMVGARLAMAEPGAHREPRRLVELIGRHRVTTLHFVPSMLQAFVEHEGACACDGLKRVICSGEALPAELANRAQRTLPRAALYNLYGPTEAAIDVTHWTCRAGDDSVPIGRPIGNVTTYVLDGAMNVVPPGVAGELYLGGAGLARGYLHRAVLTAERFVPDPFDTEGGRLYRTGDLARWNGEGALEYLGRIDHQVKVRGFRIEPGEIEAQLLAQAGVRDAVVTAHAGPGGTRLVAYVTAQAGGTLAAQPLRERLAVVLPDYMVPGAIVVLDALPLNPNGKVDRRALPAPDAVAREYEAPAGDVETALARIWQQVLGVEQVGRHDNFFELGGDSILSLKVVERTARAGFALAPRDLFEQQTVAALAARVSVVSVAGQPGVEARIEPVPADRRATLPLSHAQQRQWFLWNLQPDSSAYHIAGGLRVRGPLDADAARAAFDAICACHDVLRTTFGQTENGLPAQTVHASMPVDWRVARVDAADAQTVAQAFAAEPFDLVSGPLMRVALLELADDEHLLVLVMHHIVSDAWSIELIVDEFVAHYAAVQESRAVNAEPLPLQYGDYAVWQRARLDGGEAARQLAYWRGLLGGEHPVLALPADGPRRPLAEWRAARHEIALPAALADAVRAQARARNTTPFVVFLTALHALLHRYTGQRRVRTGVPVANRHHPDTQRLIGFFVNTQVLQADIEPATTLAQLMRELGERAADAQTHQDLPFDVLVDALGVERSLTHTPLFQVMHNHVRREWRSLRAIRGLEVEPYVVAGGTAQFELMLETREEADGALVASLRYARDLFHEETIARMGRHYRALLEAVVCDPATAIGEVGLLDDGERGTLLEWGSACSVDEAVLPLHGQIARQAARRADAVAVSCEGHALSYGELNARANRLAHRLIALGVGPEVRVGLAMERSLELVVGLLAILKAGGAYVPLDPSYPLDRLAYMIGDSGIALLLAQSSVVERLPSSSNVRTLLIDALDVSDEPATDPVVAVHESNLAYVIYTSGSTGRPKGAQLTHRNVARLLTSTQHGFDFNDNDVWTLFHSYAFDFSVWEIFGALCHGGRLVVVPYLVSRSPEEFVELLHREQVTVLNQTPSAFRQLMAIPGLYDEKNLSLRLVIFGGEALEPQTLRPWFDHFGDEKPRLVNMYGIT